MNIVEDKRILRMKIWRLLEAEGVARFPLPIRGRIPNFEGSERAAQMVKNLKEWEEAGVVFANPDSPQRTVRELALREGKTLIMATPRLRQGYLEVKPVHGRERVQSTISGAFKYGRRIDEPFKPDLVVTGCVAVDTYGWRLGKGGGYGDREIKEALRFGRVPILTTVHELQIVSAVPHEEHDTKVDYIITPNRIIKCRGYRMEETSSQNGGFSR
ncbi:MAG: 5-formyltetrahydrofolate cyclo-ligase [Candidatus Bathyarchaeia archaeon]